MARILLVDDDPELIASLTKALEQDAHKVVVAGDGKAADDILIKDPHFDAMIADVQMPVMSGIELIRAVRARNQVPSLPIILMTGFTELIEARDAYELGANEFLPKPFQKNELSMALKRVLGRQPDEAPLETYYRLGIDEFANGRKIKFAIFVRVAADRYIKVAHKGEDVTPERIKSYKNKGLSYLFIKQDDFRQFVGFPIDIDWMVRHPADRERKVALMKQSAQFLSGINHEGTDEHGFEAAAAFVEASLDLLTDDVRAMDLLDRLRRHADQVLSHSLGVSVYSVMISQRIKWNLPTNRFKVAIGALLHDVGQQEISQHILANPQKSWSEDDRKAYQSHCMLGHDMLDQLSNIPDDVRQIVKQHHENCQSRGFPYQVKKSAIHPMAKLIAVADEFCYRVVHPQGMSPHAALQEMMANCSDLLDKEFLGALVSLFRTGDLQLNRA